MEGAVSSLFEKFQASEKAYIWDWGVAQLIMCMLTMYDSPVFRFPEPLKLCMAVHTCNFSTQEEEAGRSEIHGYP